MQLTIDRINEGIDSPRSTTYRYINTLCEKGLLEKTAPGVYQPGIQLLLLSTLALQQNTVGVVARPFMEELADQTRETILLTRRAGHRSVCVDRVEAQHGVRISFEIGQSQPLHAGASSKILLAYLPEGKQAAYLSEPLESFTEHTVTDPDDLRQQLAQIRTNGYCVSQSEVDDGATSISVPIHDRKNAVLAALSLAGPSFRIDEAAIATYVDLLTSAAAEIEEQIATFGYPTPSP